MHQTPFNPDLSIRRDNDILRHVHRMRISTRAVLHAMFFLGCSLNAVSQATARMVKHGLLNTYPLYGKRTYFTLGPRCVRLYGVSRRKCLVLGEQILPTEFGVLGFCCLTDIIRKRLIPDELRARYPWIPRQFYTQPTYIDKDDRKSRLAVVHVEMADQPRYVVQKHSRQLHAYREHSRLRQLIENDEFMVVTVTTTPERRDAIIAEIHNTPWYPAFRVMDYGELIHLL